MRIYIASSWRNRIQQDVVKALREAGHEVYDFRNPSVGVRGFSWSEIDPNWESWDPYNYVCALDHPRAIEGYRLDFDAMQWAEGVLLVQPCGRSAHLELGWAAGAGKRTAILLAPDQEPELMVKMVDRLCITLSDAIKWAQDRPAASGGGEE